MRVFTTVEFCAVSLLFLQNYLFFKLFRNSIVMEPDLENGISPLSPRKARKSQRRPEMWKRNVAKKLRLVGKHLTSFS